MISKFNHTPYSLTHVYKHSIVCHNFTSVNVNLLAPLGYSNDIISLLQPVYMYVKFTRFSEKKSTMIRMKEKKNACFSYTIITHIHLCSSESNNTNETKVVKT